MAQSLLATGIPFMGRGTEEDHDKFLAEMKAVMSVSAGLRRFGSAALDLAYVAAGRFDGLGERTATLGHGRRYSDCARGWGIG